jgi:hypothetical protein
LTVQKQWLISYKNNVIGAHLAKQHKLVMECRGREKGHRCILWPRNFRPNKLKLFVVLRCLQLTAKKIVKHLGRNSSKNI